MYLWESGFLHEKGQIRQVFRWDQIESIQGRAGNNPQIGFLMFSYKVRRSDGYEVTLKNGIVVPCLKMDLVRHPAFARSIAVLQEWGVHILHEPERSPSPLMVPREEVLSTLQRLLQKAKS